MLTWRAKVSNRGDFPFKGKTVWEAAFLIKRAVFFLRNGKGGRKIVIIYSREGERIEDKEIYGDVKKHWS